MNSEEKLIEKIDAIKEKQIYYKLKRYEKNELKSLNKQLMKIKEQKTINLKKIEEEEKKKKRKA